MTHKTFSLSLSPSHPKALYLLSFIELWERFSHFGLRVLLILYMTTALGLNDISAYGIYGMYFALVNTSTVAGGYLADRYLGHQKAIFLGGLFIAAGHIFLLFFNDQTLLNYGLAFIVAGTGFFKANITSLLGQHYQLNDPRRDGGFTIFYMGLNLGAFLAPFICGYIGRYYGWSYGFGISGIGIFIGLITLKMNAHILGKGSSAHEAILKKSALPGVSVYQAIVLGTLLSIPVIAYFIRHNDIFGHLLNFLSVIMVIVILKIALKCNSEERKSMLTLVTMTPFFVVFWTSFEQAGASINLFIHRHVDRSFMGYEIETAWFQSLTPFFILILGPVFSVLWLQLGRRKKEPYTPVKFSLALFQISLSFLLLKLGVAEGATNSTTSMSWIMLSYFFRTTGELCLAPIALSMVTKLAPPRFTSLMTGMFFLSLSFAHIIAQQIARYFTAAQEVKQVACLHDKATSFYVFGQIFEFLMYMPLFAGILLLLISPLLKNVFQSHR